MNKGFLAKLTLGEDRPLVQEDFSTNTNDRLDTLNLIFANLADDSCISLINDQAAKKHFLAPLVTLCGENVQSTLWTNAHIIQTSYLILATIKRDVFKVSSVSEIFHKDEVNVPNSWH